MKRINNYDEIVKEVKELLKLKERAIVLVGGPSRAGKSTLTQYCSQRLIDEGIENQCLSLDNWILAKSLRTPDMNVLERFQSKRIESDFVKLVNGESITIDAYDAQSQGNQRIEKYISINDSGVVWIDGVISLALETLIKNSDIKVFVDIDESVRKERLYNFYKWKGLSDEEVDKLYADRNKDEFPFAMESSKNADIIFEARSRKQ